jgi:hypothetical protein
MVRQQSPVDSLEGTSGVARAGGVDIRRLLTESTSIADLEDRLKARGIEFTSLGTFIKWVEDEWEKATETEAGLVLGSSPRGTGFLTKSVSIDGVDYLLHGVMHGAKLAAWGALSPSLRGYLEEQTASFHDPGGAEDYVYEENLNDVFKLLPERELGDHSLGGKTMQGVSFFSYLRGQLKQTLGIARGAATLPLAYRRALKDSASEAERQQVDDRIRQ